ncbi:MAG: putative zinc-binding metallopeptidase [Prevotellaceae bacterium]|jgi:substrate import-associated zinc metallohydrolase lipoprotein|nr:putative zinc-binding metallopeptidase [Prevotellaceae bacterium]
MAQKKILHIAAAALYLSVLQSCSGSQETFEASIFDTTPPARTELDRWLYNNFTAPYNIEVQYKWDYSEVDWTKHPTPASEDKVKELMELLLQTWVKACAAVGGEDFFKTTAPKQLSLIGSELVEEDSGSKNLGYAEGGRRITLTEVNHLNFSPDPKHRERLIHFMKTTHHEFTHIVNQVKLYTPEFQKITAGGYVSIWTLPSEQEAYDNGFISKYARSSPNEDFAEMVGFMATSSKEEWEARINKAQTEYGKSKIREKEKVVAAYYMNSWRLDIYALRDSVQAALERIVNNE